jgi:hypothetical protein
MIGGNGRQPLIDTGIGLLSSLLGQSKIGGLVHAVSGFSGISTGSARSLLGVLGPVVMSVLKREQRTSGLDIHSVTSMLTEQKDNIARALPAGFTNLLGSSGLLEGISDRLGAGVSAARETAAATTRAAVDTAQQVGVTGRSWLRWAIPLAAVVIIVWAAAQFLFKSETVEEAARQTADKVVTTTTQVTGAARQLVVGGVDLGSEITGVFRSATEALQGITDVESAQAALPKLTRINEQLNSLSGFATQMSGDGKKVFAGVVAKALPGLREAVEKINAIPGAGEVLKPALEPIMQKLSAFTQV